MMKSAKKVISAILVMVLIATMLPVTCFATEDNTEYITLEVSVDTTIREKATQDSQALSKVRAGGYLLCDGSVTNKYGNVWFRVLDLASGKEGYVYSGKVHNHECEYTPVDESDDLEYCRCGSVQLVNSGTMRTNGAFALPEQCINPEVIIALGSMGTAIGAVASTAMPYITIATVFGVTVYILLSVADNSVALEAVSTDWRKLDADYKPEEGVYYNGRIEDDFFLVDVSHPMDGYEAMESVEASIKANKASAISKKTIYWFIYTLTDLSALCLIEDYVTTHPGYTSNYCTDAHSKDTLMKQFLHYHITATFDPFGSHLGGHIMYGAPQLDTFNTGAWA